MRDLEVIVKLTERCNIDCTYCYVFNSIDRSFERHSALLSTATAVHLQAYLIAAARSLQSRCVTVYFQGGEPLLQKKSRFESFLTGLRSSFKEEQAELRLAIQTNALLIDDQWIEMFGRFEVHVAVSLDGPREVNDALRVDHKKRGTYTRAVRGLERVLAAFRASRLKTPPSVLTVIQPQQDAEAIFHHFVRDLGVQDLHYQMPDASHNSVNRPSSDALADYLHRLFVAWSKTTPGAIRVRLFSDSVRSLVRRNPQPASNVAISISSDGDVGPPDDWRNYTPELFELGLTVRNSSVHDYLNEPRVAQAAHEIASLPSDCFKCVWRDACRGGAFVNPLHRHRVRNGFHAKSVYCTSLQAVFLDSLEFLLQSGASPKQLAESVAEALIEMN